MGSCPEKERETGRGLCKSCQEDSFIPPGHAQIQRTVVLLPEKTQRFSFKAGGAKNRVYAVQAEALKLLRGKGAEKGAEIGGVVHVAAHIDVRGAYAVFGKGFCVLTAVRYPGKGFRAGRAPVERPEPCFVFVLFIENALLGKI